MNHSIQKDLWNLQDNDYKQFHQKLIPNVPAERIIGVRTPVLRQYAKKIKDSEAAARFLNTLPHYYYEENNLHAFLLEQEQQYDALILQLNRFLPYVDNWATCDMLSPKIFRKHLPELKAQIAVWLKSEHTYTLRFGIGMLMKYFLDDRFSPDYLTAVAGICSEEYYVNMMIAWYFATALAKQYHAPLPVFTERRLAPWTHNKALQKALESRRLTAEQKENLRRLKIR